MDAREVTSALGGQWRGSSGMCRCPCHRDKTPSLQIRDGDNGDLVTHCFAGCDWRDVKAALRRRGLIPEWTPTEPGRPGQQFLKDGKPFSAGQADGRGGADVAAQVRRDINTKYALELWRGARAAGTIAETYFGSRGLTVAIPPSIRERPGLKHRPSGLDHPAIIAAVQGPDSNVVAVHRTYLAAAYTRKASITQARMMLGPLSHNSVRLGPAAEKMALAEGLENGLSILQSCAGLPVWCGLSAGNLAPLLPEVVKEVVMCLDGDLPGSPAFEASETAAQELISRGLKVRKFRAPRGMDHNDLLQLPANVVPLPRKEAAHG